MISNHKDHLLLNCREQVVTISTKEQPMNGGENQAQPEVIFKTDELLESKFIIHYRRTEVSALAEAGFCALLLMTGFIEIITYREFLCGYCLICAGFLFLCLFLQFYLGVIFNCWPLLICHAFEAGGMFICIFTLLMCSLVLSHPAQIVTTPYRNSLMLTLSSGIITSVLLATFAASSLSRARELWAFEVSHTDHLRRLLIETLDTLELYKQEFILTIEETAR